MQVKHPSKPPIALPIAHSVADNHLISLILPKWHNTYSAALRIFITAA